MSKLARRRDARDLWVSRSHVVAALPIVLGLCGVCFFGGYSLGRARVATTETVQQDASLVGGVPGEDLLVLLAKMERGAMPSESSAVFYPEMISKGASAPVPVRSEPVPGVTATVRPSPLAGEPEADAPPEGSFTIAVGWFDEASEARRARDHLRSQGHDAWLSLVRVEGEPRHRVSVGGYDDADAADEAVGVVAEAMRTSPVTLGNPAVVSLEPGGGVGIDEPGEAPAP